MKRTLRHTRVVLLVLLLGAGVTRYMKNGYYVIKDNEGKIISYGREGETLWGAMLLMN